jgi:hypothetical protein
MPCRSRYPPVSAQEGGVRSFAELADLWLQASKPVIHRLKRNSALIPEVLLVDER